jgi:hypothetical protein
VPSLPGHRMVEGSISIKRNQSQSIAIKRNQTQSRSTWA